MKKFKEKLQTNQSYIELSKKQFIPLSILKNHNICIHNEQNFSAYSLQTSISGKGNGTHDKKATKSALCNGSRYICSKEPNIQKQTIIH